MHWRFSTRRIANPQLPSYRSLPAAKKIWLAERVTEFENTLKIALLHEMIHANMHAHGFDADPNHEHPPEFKAEVKRLMALGAYEDLL